MATPDVRDDPRYFDAERQLLRTIYSIASRTWPEAVHPYAEASMATHDLLSEPAFGLIALRLPARRWPVAVGRFRPENWWDVNGLIRHRAAVRRAKREIAEALDRKIRWYARPRH